MFHVCIISKITCAPHRIFMVRLSYPTKCENFAFVIKNLISFLRTIKYHRRIRSKITCYFDERSNFYAYLLPVHIFCVGPGLPMRLSKFMSYCNQCVSFECSVILSPSCSPHFSGTELSRYTREKPNKNGVFKACDGRES